MKYVRTQKLQAFARLTMHSLFLSSLLCSQSLINRQRIKSHTRNVDPIITSLDGYKRWLLRIFIVEYITEKNYYKLFGES